MSGSSLYLNSLDNIKRTISIITPKIVMKTKCLLEEKNYVRKKEFQGYHNYLQIS